MSRRSKGTTGLVSAKDTFLGWVVVRVGVKVGSVTGVGVGGLGVGNAGDVETIVLLARLKTVTMDDIFVWLRSD